MSSVGNAFAPLSENSMVLMMMVIGVVRMVTRMMTLTMTIVERWQCQVEKVRSLYFLKKKI